MPVIDRIKISQEINFNGMPTWIGIEGTLLPDEDTIEGLRTIQKKISEYQQEEEKAFGKRRWGKPDQPTASMIEQMKACTELDKEKGGLLSFELAYKTEDEKQVYNEMLKKWQRYT